MIRIRFFGPGELIQRTFRAAQYLRVQNPVTEEFVLFAYNLSLMDSVSYSLMLLLPYSVMGSQ